MAEPLGAPFLLRCAEHDVDFAAWAVASGAVDAMIAAPAAAARLPALAGVTPATLVVDAGDRPADLEERWAAQREAKVLCAPTVRLSAAELPDLEGLRRTAQLTDPRPVLALVAATIGVLAPALAALPGVLRDSGADAVALTVSDVDWQFADATHLEQLLSTLAAFSAAGVPLVVEDAERLGPGLVAAGAAGFTDALPHARRKPLGDGPPIPVGYIEPGTWNDVPAFRSATAALVAGCDQPGCRALDRGRTRGDLREHRAHLAAKQSLRAETDPVAVIESLRGAGDSYVRAWGDAVAASRSAAA